MECFCKVIENGYVRFGCFYLFSFVLQALRTDTVVGARNVARATRGKYNMKFFGKPGFCVLFYLLYVWMLIPSRK